MDSVTVNLRVTLKGIEADNTTAALDKVKTALRDYIEDNFDNVKKLVDNIGADDIIFSPSAFYSEDK